MPLPNFLVIGVAKAGTTSLHHYLRAHPDVYLYPGKEANYFWTEARAHGRRPVQTLAAYEALFAGAGRRRAVGEISPRYMPSAGAADHIRRELPSARLIVVLRNPVERAWSDYLGRVRILREHRSFEEAIQPGEECLEHGFYAAQLARYLARFPREQLLVLLHDEFRADPRRTLRDVFAFIGVDPHREVDVRRTHNAAAVPHSPRLNRIAWPAIVAAQALVPRRLRGSGTLAALLSRTYRRAPDLPVHLRHRLCETYRDDVLATSALIGRDLSAWVCATSRHPTRAGGA